MALAIASSSVPCLKLRPASLVSIAKKTFSRVSVSRLHSPCAPNAITCSSASAPRASDAVVALSSPWADRRTTGNSLPVAQKRSLCAQAAALATETFDEPKVSDLMIRPNAHFFLRQFAFSAVCGIDRKGIA